MVFDGVRRRIGPILVACAMIGERGGTVLVGLRRSDRRRGRQPARLVGAARRSAPPRQPPPHRRWRYLAGWPTLVSGLVARGHAGVPAPTSPSTPATLLSPQSTVSAPKSVSAQRRSELPHHRQRERSRRRAIQPAVPRKVRPLLDGGSAPVRVSLVEVTTAGEPEGARCASFSRATGWMSLIAPGERA